MDLAAPAIETTAFIPTSTSRWLVSAALQNDFLKSEDY
jgi:hypothetical protein